MRQPPRLWSDPLLTHHAGEVGGACMRATGPQGTDAAVPLFTSSAAAKRAYFSAELCAGRPASSWQDRQLVCDRRDAKSARPEIARVICGHKLHRLRLVAAGGPAVLLDHPQLDRKAELAMVALGAPRPDCLLVFDAIAGRTSTRNILWRRRAYAIASKASLRRSSRRRGRTPALELPLVERYAAFVRHRATLWLSRLLPAGTDFDVRVVPPRALCATTRSSELWSWRDRPGLSPRARYRTLTVHVPLDWHVSVEQAHSTVAFFIDARADRRGQLLQSLHGEVQKVYYLDRMEWTTPIEAVDSANPVSPRRWQRANGPCRVVFPDTSTGVQKR
jgi:hypothetical protein